MADFVGSAACPWRPLGMPRRPPSPGSKGRADRPARQSQEGCTMTEATVSFAGNLTDHPGVRYTEGGIARARFPGGRQRPQGRGVVSSPWSRGGTTQSTRPNPCRRAAESWSWAGSSNALGSLRTAAPAPWSRSWPTSWGRASGGRRQRPGRRAARASSQLENARRSLRGCWTIGPRSHLSIHETRG